MALTLRDEVWKILSVAGIEVDHPILSCNEGDPARTDDDTCTIDQLDWLKYMSDNAEEQKLAHHPVDVRVDDIFTMANTRNLARNAPRDMDTHNYFFRLDRNAAFFRRELYSRENLGEGGMFVRLPGSVSWTRFDSVDDVAKSPAAKAAVVPILLKVLQGRSEYDRLNGKPHHGDDFGYAQAKAVSWLSRLIPAGDSNYRSALIRAFPTMNVDGIYGVWFRLQSEGEGRALEHALIAMLDDPVRASTARSLLRQISPVDSRYWSLKTAVVPQFTAESFGAVYIPLQLQEAPARVSWAGEKEPVGSYTAAGVGVQLCVDAAIDCAERRGLRFGGMLEANMMLNGFGYYGGSLKLFAGNEYIVGFAEGGVNVFRTGGFRGEGYYGDIITHGVLGAGLRVNPYPRLPFMVIAGSRMDPENPQGAAVYGGAGGTY